MQRRYGFSLMHPGEVGAFLADSPVQRKVRLIQQHHTWRPGYAHFSGDNHFALQRGMQAHHVQHNGWADIGQHFTVFPDGMVMSGRRLGQSPACIFGRNAGAICIENLGDFDEGRDRMTAAQRDAIVDLTARLLGHFRLGAPSVENVVYHHWFDLGSGARTDGAGATKSCPGTGFFGGNSVEACRAGFLPLVAAAMAEA